MLLSSHGQVFGPGGPGVVNDKDLGLVMYYHYYPLTTCTPGTPSAGRTAGLSLRLLNAHNSRGRPARPHIHDFFFLLLLSMVGFYTFCESIVLVFRYPCRLGAVDTAGLILAVDD
jgi:hypothetical protein